MTARSRDFRKVPLARGLPYVGPKGEIMGLFDKLKKGVADAKNQFVPQQQHSAAQPQPEPEPEQVEEEEVADHDEEAQFDVAGFDVMRDEGEFFNAVLHMESEGMFGGTDESRAEIRQ